MEDGTAQHPPPGSPSNLSPPTSPLASPLARRAVIDIGTNSIKLLVADVAGSEVTALTEESKQTRLGRGFYETHRLQPEAIAGTAEAVAAFAGEARRWGVTAPKVIATSAARDANNAAELIAAIRNRAGLEIEIISGEQEAHWVFQGVTSNPEFAGLPLLILDVGGGSTEFILGKDSEQFYRKSHRLGTVRLLEVLRPADPPEAESLARCRRDLKTFLQEQIAPELDPALRQFGRANLQVVGTGGTVTILARMTGQMPAFDRAQIEAMRLSQEDVRAQNERLWQLSLEERKQIVGLPRKRADVILTGVAIYEAVMECFGFAELRVSTRGLRYAALLETA